MVFEEFQNVCHGGHIGYLHGMISAILKIHVALMPHIKEFQLNLTTSLGDVENGLFVWFVFLVCGLMFQSIAMVMLRGSVDLTTLFFLPKLRPQV